MDRAECWERVATEQVADCRVFRVRKDEFERADDGRTSDFFVIDSPDWVNVVAITKTGQVVMIEQFRHGTCEMSLELPGGIVDEGESAEQAGKRELAEETGYTSDDWVFLGSCRPNPALQTNTMSYYLARDCEKTEAISLDSNESIETKLVADEELDTLIRDGAVTHSLVIAGLHYYRLTADSARYTGEGGV